jgi:hypothetical protein
VLNCPGVEVALIGTSRLSHLQQNLRQAAALSDSPALHDRVERQHS